MNKRGVLLIIILSVLCLSIISAEIPQKLNIHGRLTNSAGTALSGAYNIAFKIYNAYSGGASLWNSGSLSVTSDSDGIYDVILNATNLNFNEQYYLGITVESDSEMTPRINLTSSPYAFRANVTDYLNSSSNYEMQNLTLGQKITFALGEIIDNIIDGLISITGNLNVTGDILSNGNNLTNAYLYSTNGTYYLATNPFGFYNLTDFNIANYYLLSNPFSFYNSTTLPATTETLWNANYSTFLTHITWANAVNGTLFKTADWNTNYSANNDNWLSTYNSTYNAYNSSGFIKDWNSSGFIVNWNASGYIRDWNNASLMTYANWNATNTSYYLSSNPFSFYNSTTLSSSGLISGLGTYGYIPMWNGTASINKSAIYQNGSNIGIGTTSPNQKLHLEGTGVLNLLINSTTSGSTNEGGIILNRGDAPNGYAQLHLRTNSASGWDIGTFAGDYGIRFYDYLGTAGVRLYIQNTTGNVGIGTTSPRAKLDVWGSALGDNVYLGGIATGRFVEIGTNANGEAIIQGRSNRGGVPTNVSLTLQPYAGNVGINTTSPGTKLDVNGVGRFAGLSSYSLSGTAPPDGSLYSPTVWTDQINGYTTTAITIGGGSAYNLVMSGKVQVIYSGADANRYTVYWNSVAGDLIFVSSDEKLKENINNISSQATEKVKALNPVTFNFKNNTQNITGFLAQEVIKVDPTLAWHWVNETNPTDEKWGLNGWDGFVALLVKSSQEQQKIIEQQNNTINDLKKALCSSSIKSEFVELCK